MTAVSVCKQTLLLIKNFKRMQYPTASITDLIPLSNSHHIKAKTSLAEHPILLLHDAQVGLSNLKSAIAGLLANLL